MIRAEEVGLPAWRAVDEQPLNRYGKAGSGTCPV